MGEKTITRLLEKYFWGKEVCLWKDNILLKNTLAKTLAQPREAISSLINNRQKLSTRMRLTNLYKSHKQIAS